MSQEQEQELTTATAGEADEETLAAPETETELATSLAAEADVDVDDAADGDAQFDADDDDVDDDDDDADADDDDDDDDDADEDGQERGLGENGREARARRTVAELEEEGEIAADYLEELLDIADFGGDIEIDVENDRASIDIVADDAEKRRLQRLVGTDGEVLEALQELTRLAVQARTGERSRLMLDIADFRAERKAELAAITNEAITKAKTDGKPVKLRPMNPFERKVCHDVVAAAGLYSESEGADRSRCVVVYPDTQD